MALARKLEPPVDAQAPARCRRVPPHPRAHRDPVGDTAARRVDAEARSGRAARARTALAWLDR